MVKVVEKQLEEPPVIVAVVEEEKPQVERKKTYRVKKQLEDIKGE